MPPELPRPRRSSKQASDGEGSARADRAGSNPHPDVHYAFVGQGPGEMEARFSQPFHPNAPSGHLLNQWIYSAGLQRTEVLLTNVVWCWMPASKVRGCARGSREPTEDETTFCMQAHLRPLLAEYGFIDDQPEDRKVIVTIGAPASRTFLGDTKTERHLGTMVRREV